MLRRFPNIFRPTGGNNGQDTAGPASPVEQAKDEVLVSTQSNTSVSSDQPASPDDEEVDGAVLVPTQANTPKRRITSKPSSQDIREEHAQEESRNQSTETDEPTSPTETQINTLFNSGRAIDAERAASMAASSSRNNGSQTQFGGSLPLQIETATPTYDTVLTSGRPDENESPLQRRMSAAYLAATSTSDSNLRDCTRVANDGNLDESSGITSRNSNVPGSGPTQPALDTMASNSEPITYMTGEPGQQFLGTIRRTVAPSANVKGKGIERQIEKNEGGKQERARRSSSGSMKTYPNSIMKKPTPKNSNAENIVVPDVAQQSLTSQIPAENSQPGNPPTQLVGDWKTALDLLAGGSNEARGAREESKPLVSSQPSERDMTLKAKERYNSSSPPEVNTRMVELPANSNRTASMSPANEEEQEYSSEESSESVEHPYQGLLLESKTSRADSRARYAERKKKRQENAARIGGISLSDDTEGKLSRDRAISFSDKTQGELTEPIDRSIARAEMKRSRLREQRKAQSSRAQADSGSSRSSSRDNPSISKNGHGQFLSSSKPVDSIAWGKMSAGLDCSSGGSRTRAFSTTEDRKFTSTKSTDSDSQQSGSDWSGGPLKTIREGLQIGPEDADCLKCPSHCEPPAPRDISPELRQAVEKLVQWLTEMRDIEHRLGTEAQTDYDLGEAGRIRRNMRTARSEMDPLGDCCEDILSKPQNDDRDFAFWGSATRYMRAVHEERLKKEFDVIIKRGWDVWGSRSFSEASGIPPDSPTEVSNTAPAVVKKDSWCRCILM